MDDFYKPAPSTDRPPQGHSFLSKIWDSIPIPPLILATLLLGPLLIFLTAQLLLIGGPVDPEEEQENNSWMVLFQPVPWRVLESFFGIPKRSEEKYQKASEELNSCNRFILDEPHKTTILKISLKNLERNIPQMISFISTPIDLQPWEHHAQTQFLSPLETELNLPSLIRSMMGHALIPAAFGHALLEKHPSILQDMNELDLGRSYLLRNLPPWTPWPGVVKAHIARSRVWTALDDVQRVLDESTRDMGGGADSTWGDLEDVSLLVRKRNEIYRERKFEIKERGDITILHSLLAHPTLLPLWQILHILSTPNLLPLIRTEITPYAKVAKPFSIGAISEAPKLALSLEGLTTKCPLLRSTFLETLRLVDRKWTSVSGGRMGNGEGIAFPETFDAERFLSTTSPGLSLTGGSEKEDASLNKSYTLIEQATLALVAGILVFWDFEPVEKGAGWKVPEKLWIAGGGVAVPAGDLRVRIKRRKFEWMG
ncbi:hypothetical protein BKA65DRAFT_512162 [Rhexocercosporidium sp. MPI-PUGE-AT-0058]|nr:hypothetical protein BKA65DRAFT_512162 [Rhexocercosporidium sp. MPI-PUGE-AT-0058]